MMANRSKRNVIAALFLLPLLISCNAVETNRKVPEMSSAQQRSKGVGLTLVTDAVSGAEMLGVEFFADGSDRPFYASSRLTRQNRERMSYPRRVVPEKVRVVWRTSGSETYFDKAGLIRYSAKIVGDFTIPVASRIPDEVIADIRKNGGALRLKFRLKKDGVLFGWDIERAPAEERKYSREEIRAQNLYFPSEYLMVGGDFTETRY